MKTLILLLLTLFPAAGFSQNPDEMIYSGLDQTRAAILKPALEAYIAQSLQLTESIRKAATRKEARNFASQLQENSLAFGKAVAALYGYHKSTDINMVIIPTANGGTETAFVTNTVKIGSAPGVYKTVMTISEYAAHYSCFGWKQAEHANELEQHLAKLKP